MVALHGNAQSGATALAGWQAITRMGWLLAAIQSSQAEAQDAFIWDNQAVAQRDVTTRIADLLATYPVDRSQLILAGFSMGGETALRLALTGAVLTQRFLLLGPGGPMMDEPDAWNALIAAADRGLRGYVFVGANDDDAPQDAIREVVTRLTARGIACRLEVLPDLRHEYPHDDGVALRRALRFLLD
jgi:pimeloyl-ACP methyl ester carboxylesterase